MKIRKKDLATLLMYAKRIFRYRNDILSTSDCKKLEDSKRRLEEFISEFRNIKNDEKLIKEIDLIDKFLLRVGGKIYPKTFWIDNVECGLIALIVVLGIKAFFFQAFIIPTNSMYPTYSGMKEILYDLDAEPLTSKEKILNRLIRGSKNYHVASNLDGRVSIPFFSQSPYSKDINLRRGGIISYKLVNGRKWLGLLPAIYRQYEIFVGNNSVKIIVPKDYSLDEVILKTYFSEYNSLKELIKEYHSSGRINLLQDIKHIIKTRKIVKKGDTLISFDLTIGDALFVDRISYHFIKPKPGDPFVFKTSKMGLSENLMQKLGDKYYIKRIGGIENETITIVDGKLYSNGKQRNETKVFLDNSNKVGEYNGYKSEGLLSANNSFTIPDDHYFALGDNSYNSTDSRYFGPVRKRSLIGKPFIISYPFTSRWGICK